ncbi:uncharacterized protein Z518_05647 [Rhinocladiella mackenziei CBS 650.93]|uniref:Zn(2)-C6 fungal-type domain-containing protein n=1 Tax=Rhinocladiella mackenziei CBS 650.93 TaxID=1442369 RepID=A0A0D2FRG8_9EURO|nr:uncharacterized protein Z518_05647 [Rhinocladiella mackenziei CBS 650.93]KIX04777.1 hypothetical protein Z518_05647 [Rhinocladiella mackenziei CBS 650.93]
MNFRSISLVIGPIDSLFCRIRRVKCDEVRPSCKRCSSTGRKCDGYAAPRQEPVAALLVVTTETYSSFECDRRARTAFQFFYEVCAPTLLNYGGQSFWNRLVLQACHVHLSIQHLIIAASRLGSHNGQMMDSVSATEDPVFLSHYGKALKMLSQARSPDPGLVLMACLLLILCDEFQQNSFAALQHIIAGRKILAAYGADRSIPRNATVEEIGLLFSKLELYTTEFNQQTVPKHTWWPLPTNTKQSNIQFFATPPHTRMTSIQEAADSLQAIALECVSLQLGGRPPPTRFHTVPPLTTKLNDWLDSLSVFEANMHSKTASQSLTELHLLRGYHLCLHAVSRCAPFGEEAAFDLYVGSLEYVVVSAGLLLPSAPLRLLPMVFFVATRYRSASFRRRAIEMLRQSGVDGQILAKIALRVVRIEERNIHDPIVCSDIPESNRIRLSHLDITPDGGFYHVHYRHFPYTDQTPLERFSVPTQAFASASPLPLSNHASQLLIAVLKFDFMMFWNLENPAFSLPRYFKL